MSSLVTDSRDGQITWSQWGFSTPDIENCNDKHYHVVSDKDHSTIWSEEYISYNMIISELFLL